MTKRELDATRRLLDKIIEIVQKQHKKKAHEMTEGQLRSLHKAYDWIDAAKKKLDLARAELDKLK